MYLDVYASFNNSMSWQQQTLEAAWINRDAMYSYTHYSIPLGKSILIIFGGDTYNGTVHLNLGPDLWASSDSGVTWTQLASRPLLQRNHGVMGTQVSKANIIVITSGKLSESGTLYGNGRYIDRRYTI